LVNVELVDTEINSVLWGEQYNEKITELLAVQEKIAMAISENLRWQLSGEEQSQMTARGTQDPEAYEAYLKGQYSLYRWTEEEWYKSIEYFEQAIEKDSGYAQAYAGLAASYYSLITDSHLPPKEGYAKGKTAVDKALEIENDLAEAHHALGLLRWICDWDWAGAEEEGKLAIELNPNFAQAHHRYAITSWVVTGRLEGAIERIRLAHELDPLSLTINNNVAWIHYTARRYDKAIEQYQKTLDLEPNFLMARRELGLAYAQKSMFPEAIAEFEEAISLSDDLLTLSYRGYGYAMAGRRDEEMTILEMLREERDPNTYAIAAIYSLLGEKDQAFEWLERGYQKRDIGAWLRVQPQWDPFGDDPRFHDLRRMNLEP